jgi:hypothetical protein
MVLQFLPHVVALCVDDAKDATGVAVAPDNPPFDFSRQHSSFPTFAVGIDDEIGGGRHFRRSFRWHNRPCNGENEGAGDDGPHVLSGVASTTLSVVSEKKPRGRRGKVR